MKDHELIYLKEMTVLVRYLNHLMQEPTKNKNAP